MKQASLAMLYRYIGDIINLLELYRKAYMPVISADIPLIRIIYDTNQNKLRKIINELARQPCDDQVVSSYYGIMNCQILANDIHDIIIADQNRTAKLSLLCEKYLLMYSEWIEEIRRNEIITLDEDRSQQILQAVLSTAH